MTVIRIELHAEGLNDLRDQVIKLADELGIKQFGYNPVTVSDSNTALSFPDVPPEVRADEIADEQYAEQLKEEAAADAIQPLPTGKKPRVRKPKQTPAEVFTPPVTSEVVVDPKTVHSDISLDSPVPPSSLEVPSNFFSESEFITNFAKIISQLLTNKTITQTWLADVCAKYKVPFIFSLASHRAKLIELYADMVNQGLLTRKGDY